MCIELLLGPCGAGTRLCNWQYNCVSTCLRKRQRQLRDITSPSVHVAAVANRVCTEIHELATLIVHLPPISPTSHDTIGHRNTGGKSTVCVYSGHV